jgi:hypothetical protein
MIINRVFINQFVQMFNGFFGCLLLLRILMSKVKIFSKNFSDLVRFKLKLELSVIKFDKCIWISQQSWAEWFNNEIFLIVDFWIKTI